jgi:hypothetical protein
MRSFTRTHPATVILAVLLLASLTFLSGVQAAKTWKFDAITCAGNQTIGGTLGVTGASTLASVGVTGAATVGTTLGVTGVTTLAGNLVANGGATLGNAATDVITCTGALIPRTLAGNPVDDTAADRPAGTVGEIALNAGKLYLCTDATADAEVWVAVGPPAG